MPLDRATVAAALRALDLGAIAGERWYASKGEPPLSARLAHAFALGDDAALALVDLQVGDRLERYSLPFAVRGGEVRPAEPGDGAWRGLAAAIAEARTIPALVRNADGTRVTGVATHDAVEAALVCRPSPGFEEAWGEHALGAAAVGAAHEEPLGRDQTNTSVVLDGRLVLKAYRRVQPGLNPDLELTAFLSEEAAFTGVPRLAGWAEVVTRDGGAATVAMLQAYVGDAEDVYEETAERLAGLVAAPGAVTVEWATDIAEDLGTLVAGLHAALASPSADTPDFVVRPATREELHAWRIDAQRQLNRAVASVTAVDAAAGAELRREAAAIAARFSRFEALATAPVVTRIHADLHLGQVLVADDGYRVIDFEGEPLRPIDERRRPDSPLRDVASMLRSLDHVARSAGRRAERRRGGPIERPGLDIDAWIGRARQRFLAAYTAGIRASGAPIVVDLDLLDAFEVAKECYEFTYAATVLPTWLWAPQSGMRWLLARGQQG